MTRTLQEIADELGVPKEAADGLMKYLRAIQQARFRGERPSPTGRGKGAHVYDIQRGAGEAIARAIVKIED